MLIGTDRILGSFQILIKRRLKQEWVICQRAHRFWVNSCAVWVRFRELFCKTVRDVKVINISVINVNSDCEKHEIVYKKSLTGCPTHSRSSINISISQPPCWQTPVFTYTLFQRTISGQCKVILVVFTGQKK